METTYTIGADGLPHIPKVAGKKLEFSLDLSDYMAEIGAGLSSFAVIIPSGLISDSSENIKNGDVATVFISGGTTGYSYPIHFDFTISGSPSRTDRRTIVIDVVSVR